ncbi:MAG: tetratricopeptide repeat protein [Candidatus Thorarchaeota archaeon]
MNDEDLGLALEALEEGRFDEAEMLLEKLAELDNENPDVLVYLGIAYVQTEKPAKAVDVLRNASELVEEHSVLSLFLGRALKALGHLHEAELELRKAVRLDPRAQDAWRDLANVLVAEHEYAAAIHVAEEGLELFSRDAALRTILALSLHRLGDYTASTEEWAKVHSLRPDLLVAAVSCANDLLIQGLYNEAHPFVAHASKLDDQDNRPKILRSELHMQRGEDEAALKILQAIVEGSSLDAPVLARLAVLNHRAGDSEKRDEYIRKTEEAIVDTPQGWRALYYIYNLLAWNDEMIDCLIRGTLDDAGSASPWVALAKVYNKLGKTEDAEHAWGVSFGLRRYVKIHCASCGLDLRIPYETGQYFDLSESRTCEKCGKTMQMPASIAVF